VIESDLARSPGRPEKPAKPGRPGRATTAGGIVVIAVAVLAVAAVERSRLAGSLTTLARLHWTWLPAGILLEAASMAAFTAMFRRLLAAGRVQPRRVRLLATIYAANAMSVSVPLAGPGLAAAYLFRRFSRLGAGALLAGWVLLAGGVISAATWLLVLIVGGLASGHTVALAVAVPLVTLAVILTAMIVVAARRPRLRAALEKYLAQSLKHGARLLRWPATDSRSAVRAWTERFGALRLSPSSWALAAGDALVNWIADAAVLAVSILAVGAAIPWRDLLLVYLAGITAQGLSLTPGGLAITEGAISVSLVASGLRVGQAVTAAVLYRLISFWLVAAVGWLILLVLRVRGPAAESAPEPELEPAPGQPSARQPGAHELVLLHGQPGTAADWQAVMARLPPQLHAVAVDRPGYGGSELKAVGFTANAQAVLNDLIERKVDSVVLVAHSWASGVALEAASLAPQRVKAVVLLAGVGPGSVGIVDWLLAAPFIGPLSAQIMWRWTPWIARARLAWLRRRQGGPLQPGEHINLQIWGQKDGSAEPVWRAFLTEQRALLRELAALEAALPSIRVPVLLLADPADQIVPIMTSNRLVKGLPNARLRLVAHAGHHIPRRAPDATVEAITAFLAAIDDSQPAGNLCCSG
jgi:putative heme transporter